MRESFVNAAGETMYRCTKCGRWLAAMLFAPLANKASKCGRKSWCRRCEQDRATLRRTGKAPRRRYMRQERPRAESDQRERDARWKDRLLSMGFIKRPSV